MKEVKISDFDYRGANFVRNGYKYAVTDLIKLAKDIEPFDLPLAGIDLSVRPWGDSMDIHDYIYHLKRLNNVDSQYPIILDRYGYICDGWHRVVNAVIKGEKTIKAIRLEVMPDPIE